jgi:hypothetical protein
MDHVSGYGPAFNMPGARDDLQPGNRSWSNWVGGVVMTMPYLGAFPLDQHYRPILAHLPDTEVAVASKVMGYFG